LLSPHTKKNLSPTDLITFPWEVAEQVQMTLPDNWEALSKAMDKEAKKEGLIQQ